MVTQRQQPRHPQPRPAHARSQGTTALVAAIVAVLAIGGIASVAVFSAQGGVGSSAARAKTGVPAAKVAAISPAEPKAALAARFGKPLRDGKYLDLELADSEFERVTFTWEEDDHLTNASFFPAAGVMPPRVIESLRKQFGRSLAGEPNNLQLSAPGVSFSVGSALHMNAHERSDPRWKARFSALWTAATHAALGGTKALDLAARRDVLNLDYELATLAKIDPTLELERSESAMRELFPGSVSSGASQSIGLSHPWFDHASLTWANESKGKLQRLNLYYPTRPAKPNHQPDIRRCLEPLLGAPKLLERDHLAKKYDLDWREHAGLPRAHASEQLLMLFHQPSGPQRTRPSEWQRVIVRLAECARAPD